jgi:hypothetical protein
MVGLLVFVMNGLGLGAAGGGVSVSHPGARATGKIPDVVSDLETASQGLLFMSESDHPLVVVHWTPRPLHAPPTAQRVARLTGHQGMPVEERTLDQFFRRATTSEPWHPVVDQGIVRRYQELVRILRRRLHSIRVFRFGRIDIASYVVGVTSRGTWVGIATHQTET